VEPFIGRLVALLAEQGGSVANLDSAICVAAGMMSWTHRDPFDRLLAAKAAHYHLPLVSADTVFDGIVTRLW
jgi:PIN domain nuclease of toxin-antitoxin system